MDKSIEQLRQLSKNPYYTLTSDEQLRLAQAESQNDSQGATQVPKVQSSKGSATVKEIGQLNKHSGDPVNPNSAELRTTNDVTSKKGADTEATDGVS